MKVNIYYGGRGLIEDPTLYVCDKLTTVLDELRVQVQRYNLFEEKSGIALLTKTLKEADGIILAATVEWFGMGGLMQTFLDSCFLYADKERLSQLYMMPVVMATTYGEKEVEYDLERAWEILGGKLCEGICAYVEDHVEFEMNGAYAKQIERTAENFYRAINQKMARYPSSEAALRNGLMTGTLIPLTPQESEQLSEYVSDDNYVKQQKEDIEELSQMFREMLGGAGDDTEYAEYVRSFRTHFHPIPDFSASYAIELADVGRIFVVEVNREELKCYYGQKEDADVYARTRAEILSGIVAGRITFQRAFMTGDLTAKGNFKTLRTFDTLFQFHKI